MKKSIALSLVMLFGCEAANATVIVSTDPGDFATTLEAFPVTGFSNNNIVSSSGNITLDNAQGIGNPATTTAAYTNWGGSILSGTEYVMSGDENFDVLFSSLQTAFAMNYEDDSISSIFTLTFFNGVSNVGTASFVTTSFNTDNFIGFISDTDFNKVTVRENDGGSNSNEYFQFYTATPAVSVPEPGTLALMGLGLAGLGFRRKRQAA